MSILSLFAGLALLILIAAIVLFFRVGRLDAEGGLGAEAPPSIQLIPNTGGVDVMIGVVGKNWPADEPITIRIVSPYHYSPYSADIANCTAQPDGTFTVYFSLPVLRPWSELPEVRVQAAGNVGGFLAEDVYRNVSVPLSWPATTSTPTPAILIEPTAARTQSPTRTPIPTATATPGFTPTPILQGWQGEYFQRGQCSGVPDVVRDDKQIRFDWGTGRPDPKIGSDTFCVRWTRTLYLPEGTYRFYAYADDGIRVWLDNQLLFDEFTGYEPVTYMEERYVGPGEHVFEIEYNERRGNARVHFWWWQQDSTDNWYHGGWCAEYYPNPDLARAVAVVDSAPDIDFNWGADPPIAGLPRDRFSVRFTKVMLLPGGNHAFSVRADDGARLYIDGEKVIDMWSEGSVRVASGNKELTAGRHTIVLEYYDAGNLASVHLDGFREMIHDPGEQ